jgi:hypothetical protein
MHKLSVGGDIMGTVFAVGVVLMFAVGIPLARWFLLGAALFGGLISVFMIRAHRRHAVEITDLSVLERTTETSEKQ